MKMLLNECKIEMIRIFRNPYFVFWSLFMPIVFYFIFTKVVNTGVDDQALWNKHFLMSIAIFSVMGSAIMTLGIRMVQERSEGWTTWIKVTPLPSSSYFISKMIGQSAVHVFSIAVVFLAGIILNGVSMTFVEWIVMCCLDFDRILPVSCIGPSCRYDETGGYGFWRQQYYLFSVGNHRRIVDADGNHAEDDSTDRFLAAGIPLWKWCMGNYSRTIPGI